MLSTLLPQRPWRMVLATLALCCLWAPSGRDVPRGWEPGAALAAEPSPTGATFALTLRNRVETKAGSGLYHAVLTPQTWHAAETAVIVCDVWDSHHCLNAVRRVQEMAPRMNALLKLARKQGALIIHAPSGCMGPYQDHPARRRALAAPRAANLPQGIGQWCHRTPAEEQGHYPIDQTDGGEDDDPQEHAAWAAQLQAEGRNPRAPWKSQLDVLEICDEDAISDSGVEVWNLLERRGIRQVMLLGVHTNMCVLGRPFGLRQLVKNGKPVVLVRDMTDTMYNPQRWPQVSHFSGTDLIVEHIEKYVCPTITSDQLLSGQEFRFAKDDRPHIALVMSEPEYGTEQTLTAFARQFLQPTFRLSFIYGDAQDENRLIGVAVVERADLAILSLRRRALPAEQLDVFRRFVAAGKPVVGIRTASHGFALSRGDPPPGHAVWPEFDREVLGGSYHGHHGSKRVDGPVATVWIPAGAESQPILKGLPSGEWPVASSLYKTSPLGPQTTLLMMGRAGDQQPHEPVAWTNTSAGGGRVFYTSLGHREDFVLPAFQRLLFQGVYWAAGREPPATLPAAGPAPTPGKGPGG